MSTSYLEMQSQKFQQELISNNLFNSEIINYFRIIDFQADLTNNYFYLLLEKDQSLDLVRVEFIDETEMSFKYIDLSRLKENKQNDLYQGLIMPSFNFAIVGSIFEVGQSDYERKYPYKVGLLYQSDRNSQSFSPNYGPFPLLTIPIQLISFEQQFELTSVNVIIQSVSIEQSNLVDLSIGLGSGAIFDFYQISKSQTVNKPLVQYEISSLVKQDCVPQNSLTYTPYFRENQTIISMESNAVRYDSSNNSFLVETFNDNDAGSFGLIINVTQGNLTFRSFFSQSIEDQCLKAIVSAPSNFVTEVNYYIGYNSTITYVFDEFEKTNPNCSTIYSIIIPSNLDNSENIVQFNNVTRTITIQTTENNYAGTYNLIIKAQASTKSLIIDQVNINLILYHQCQLENLEPQLDYKVYYYQISESNTEPELMPDPCYYFTNKDKQAYTGSVFKIVDNNEFQIFSNNPSDSGILTLMLWATNGYAQKLSYITYSLVTVDCYQLVMDTSQTVIPEFNYTISDDEQTQYFQPFGMSLPECGPIIYRIENITQVTGKTVAIYVSQNVDLPNTNNGIKVFSDDPADAFYTKRKITANFCGRSITNQKSCIQFSYWLVHSCIYAQVTAKPEAFIYQLAQPTRIYKIAKSYNNVTNNCGYNNLEILSALDKHGNMVDVSSFIQVSSITKFQIYSSNIQHYEDSPYTLRMNLFINCYTNLFTGYCTLPSLFSIKNLDGTTGNSNIFKINSGTGELQVYTNDITLSGTYTLVLKAQNSLGIYATHQVVVSITNPCIVGNSLVNTIDLTTITYDMRSGTLDTSIGWTQTNSKCPLSITYSVINTATGLTFPDCQIYSSSILRTILTSYAYVGMNYLAIVVNVGSYQQQQDDFIIEVTNTCYTNPQIYVPANQLVEYTIGQTKIISQIVGWSVSPSYCGPFSFAMTEANSKSLSNIQFNQTSMEISIYTDQLTYAGRSTGTSNCNKSMLIDDSFPFFYTFGVCYICKAAFLNN
eukprot:403337050